MNMIELEPRNSLPFYDEVAYTLAKTRLVTIVGGINVETYSHVANLLMYHHLKAPGKPIEMRLNSGGGEVNQGLAIVDYIEHIKNLGTPVNITTFGVCASMATVILQAGSERRAAVHTDFMLHEIAYGAAGKRSMHGDEKSHSDTLHQNIMDIYTAKLKMTQKEFEDLTDRRDVYFQPAEALRMGLIDKII